MEENHSKSRTQLDGMSDVVLQLLMSYIDDPKDRDAVSLICKRWYELDAQSRKHVTIALCYTTTPDRLRRRFPHLESLKLKGKPRAAMFNLIPEDWGGYVAPWVKAISESFSCLRSLHFRRMVVSDEDLELLAKSRGKVLVSLKLDKCSGFSTDGLLHLTRSCSNIRTFFLEESLIKEHDGKWLHELAQNNTVLENLNFYLTYLNKVSIEDLELIARNCRSLVSVKISECEILEHVQFLGTAAALEEFCGASTEPADAPDRYSVVTFPPRLCRLGFTYMGKNEMSIVFPIAALLKKLDLLFAMLDTEDHCLLIQRCPNLEVLETRNVIGDRGLETLAQNCNKLKRLRIERGADEPEDVEGRVSQRGLTALAQGCLELEYLAVYASDITNESLESLGKHLKKLSDFRLVLLDGDVNVIDSPLDNGVRALLMGCKMLKRFALYLQPGGLTDVGLGYVGQYSPNVRWMLLGNVGESDMGLSEFARGCPSLQKLEMRGCLFSERALALAVMQLSSLRYLWVQGYVASPTGQDLMAMARPFWNIEVIPARQVSLGNEPEETVVVEQPAQILAYYSLAGARDDCPPSVIPLDPVQVVNS